MRLQGAPRANTYHARECVPWGRIRTTRQCVPRANGYHGAECVIPRANAYHVRSTRQLNSSCNGKSSIWPQRSAIITLHVTWSVPKLIQEPTDIYREIHFREPNRFPISRSRNRSVLSVLEYRPNGSTEPIGNPERVGPNRPKHAIYRFGSNRESVLDRPNATSAYNPLESGYFICFD